MHAAPKIAQPELVPTYFDPPDQYKTIVLYWFGHLCPEPVSNRAIFRRGAGSNLSLLFFGCGNLLYTDLIHINCLCAVVQGHMLRGS